MIRTLYRHPSGSLILDLPLEQLPVAVQDTRAFLWIDMLAPSEAEYKLVLEEIYRFHPLAVEDAVNHQHVPKVNDYGSYIYLVVHTIHSDGRIVNLVSDELDIFLGANYLITVHDKAMDAINRLWQEDPHREGGLAGGPTLLLHALLDWQVDRITRLLDGFEVELERLGDAIFQRPNVSGEALLDDILTAKSSALRLYRVLAPQRDLMLRLSQTDYKVIPPSARPFFADIYDHMVRTVGLVTGMQELSRSTVDIYLALANNRMNEIMKVLTVISTIFIPLSFLAGVFGMNFHFMPELEQAWAYPLVWAIFFTIAVTMLRFFRKWKWL